MSKVTQDKNTMANIIKVKIGMITHILPNLMVQHISITIMVTATCTWTTELKLVIRIGSEVDTDMVQKIGRVNLKAHFYSPMNLI